MFYFWISILTCPLPASGSTQKKPQTNPQIMWNRIAAFSLHVPKQNKKRCVSSTSFLPKILIGQFTSTENVLKKEKKERKEANKMSVWVVQNEFCLPSDQTVHP